MSQDDMWAEIQRLRERENTLLYAVQMIVDDKESMVGALNPPSLLARRWHLPCASLFRPVEFRRAAGLAVGRIVSG